MSTEEAVAPTKMARNKLESQHRGHAITSKLIKAPAFSYICLQVISELEKPPDLDLLTARSCITAAVTQFLGLTGSAISVDILKVDQKECWIRVPREDLSVAVAALGAWIGGTELGGRIGWRVKAVGNWLSVLLAQSSSQDLWKV